MVVKSYGKMRGTRNKLKKRHITLTGYLNTFNIGDNVRIMTAPNYDSVHHVKDGCHLYQFYKGMKDYVSSISGFFRVGLLKGDACLWIIDDRHGFDAILRLANPLVPNIHDYLASGQLTLRSADQWYLMNGRFCAEQAIANAENFIQGRLQSGYEHIRVVGDCGVVPREDRLRFQAYEEKAHHIIRQAPVVVVCAYPILDCTLSETSAVLDLHDHVLVSHQ